ncbi:ABC transporter ATP-binding protein [Citricoccus zhacaiensis]|uniref:ABC transporter ATP-binding protein n=1 Tax=Citricoccus zhacaiensis TaxID=489142 RepID=A0ABQ2LWW5_9MICC|nr:ABC transporter ATP-binding protein [Citricoccus zhacaiensis]GGO44194.1 ABC transporter ATP-binding protein [Citricoccus zhacaiensis]
MTTLTDTATPLLTDPAPEGGAAGAASRPLVEVENLNVWFSDAHGRRSHVVHDVSVQIHAGECVAIIGESGSGKSVTARTLIGLTGPNSHVRADTATALGRDIQTLRDTDWRSIRGKDIGFILQDALVSLDPLRTVGAEIGESLRLHGVRDRAERAARVEQLLAEVGVPEPHLVAGQRPDQLSGGLRQRALIASAIANHPSLVVADEPTTALDVTVQAQVLDLLAQRKADGTAILLISHDFSVVGRLADRVLVMQGGWIVESGTAAEVLENPQHPYTRQLLDAVPSGHTKGEYLTEEGRARAAARATTAGTSQRTAPAGVGNPAEPKDEASQVPAVLSARGLTKSYRGPDGRDRTVVRDVSFDVHAGRTLGIVGESGSGKSTTASMALGFIAPDAGTVLLDGAPWSELSLAGRRSRRREVTVVYQDPLSSFDPRWSGERILTDALDAGTAPGVFASSRARRAHRQEQSERAAQLARLVGLTPEHLAKHPLRLSGGQRQRLSIARALAPEPKVVVLDEAVSALDVSVQAQVLDLLTELQETLGTTYLFISHDLGVIHHMSDEILVMKDGVAVEHGDADRVFEQPEHHYTQALLGSLQALSTTVR